MTKRTSASYLSENSKACPDCAALCDRDAVSCRYCASSLLPYLTKREATALRTMVEGLPGAKQKAHVRGALLSLERKGLIRYDSKEQGWWRT